MPKGTQADPHLSSRPIDKKDPPPYDNPQDDFSTKGEKKGRQEKEGLYSKGEDINEPYVPEPVYDTSVNESMSTIMQLKQKTLWTLTPQITKMFKP